MGLRREPQPPMPMVMPRRGSAATASSVLRLSVMSRGGCRSFRVGVAPFHERVAQLVGDAGKVELEGETLLEPVGAFDVPKVDAVEALLRGTDDRRRLRS